MYTNLVAMQAVNGLRDEDMASIIGVSRTTYKNRLEKQIFSAEEAKKLCAYFQRPFDWLFENDAVLGPVKEK